MKIFLLTECVIGLLVLLFVYAGSSKLWDMEGFRAGMAVQPLPAWINTALARLLPFTEIIIAVGLGFNSTRRPSLYAYVLLMFCFTVYTLLVVTGFFTRRPCGCGGIISLLSWEGHLAVNIIFLLLSWLAIVMGRHTNIFMHKQEVSRKPARE